MSDETKITSKATDEADVTMTTFATDAAVVERGDTDNHQLMNMDKINTNDVHDVTVVDQASDNGDDELVRENKMVQPDSNNHRLSTITGK